MVIITHRFNTRRTHLKRTNLWVPGEPLTEEDASLLKPIIDKSKELDRTPTRTEVVESTLIKRRFRTWGDAILAAGLPPLSDPEQVKRRNNSEILVYDANLPQHDEQ